LNEQLLIQAIQNGDVKAFTQMVETYQHLVYNTILSMLQNKEDAEDVAQDVFVQVYESIHQFKGESKFSTWLYRIAVTKSLDYQRRKKRKKRFAIIESLFGVNNEVKHESIHFYHPGVSLANKEQAAILFKAIQQLPSKQQIAFTLNKIEGLSYQEVAEIMQVTVASVEAFLHRAKQNLRKELQQYYESLK